MAARGLIEGEMGWVAGHLQRRHPEAYNHELSQRSLSVSVHGEVNVILAQSKVPLNPQVLFQRT